MYSLEYQNLLRIKYSSLRIQLHQIKTKGIKNSQLAASDDNDDGDHDYDYATTVLPLTGFPSQ